MLRIIKAVNTNHTIIDEMVGYFVEAFSESFGVRQESYKKGLAMLKTFKKEELPQDFVQFLKNNGAEFLMEESCLKS